MQRGGIGRRTAVAAALVLALVVVVHRTETARAEARAAVPGAVTRVRTGERLVALTFDDGPSSQWTPIVLERLAQAKVPATFFVIGHDVVARPDLVRQELAAGDEVGDHTYRHSLLPSLSTAKARSEIRNGASAIDDLGGTRATLFRPPYGKTTDVVDRVVEAEGMRTVLWSLSLERYVDHQSVATGVARLVGHVRPGAIILAHDGGRSNRSRTLLALPLLIRSLQQRGYRFVTVSQLLARGVPDDGRA